MTGEEAYPIADNIHCKRTKRKSLDNDEGINSSGCYNNFKCICTQTRTLKCIKQIIDLKGKTEYNM